MIDQNDAALYQSIDEEKLIARAREAVLPDAIEAAKSSLIESLQGKKAKYSWQEEGRQAPKDYDELFAEIKKNVPAISDEEIDRRVEEKLKAREERELKQLEEKRTQEAQTIEERRKQFDAEWYDLVNSGKMPKVADELQERINKGERLTKEEIMADEGLKARIDLMQFVTSTGKSAKLAYYEDYAQNHPGMSAPVFGGRPAAPSSSHQEESYEDLHAEAIKLGLVR